MDWPSAPPHIALHPYTTPVQGLSASLPAQGTLEEGEEEEEENDAPRLSTSSAVCLEYTGVDEAHSVRYTK